MSIKYLKINTGGLVYDVVNKTIGTPVVTKNTKFVWDSNSDITPYLSLKKGDVLVIEYNELVSFPYLHKIISGDKSTEIKNNLVMDKKFFIKNSSLEYTKEPNKLYLTSTFFDITITYEREQKINDICYNN